ncbi:MAG: hypothetical protein HY398_01460 [Candidatus Doudnabacteria bacterium]|nr:hypothetical protein [Candidatus Doudnabacteria bacterium]
MTKGKFIVLYGINNLGKSTQARLLVEKLLAQGRKAKYIKYPIYDLEPSGPLLNNYLREGNTYKLTPKEAQIIYAFNRAQYEPELKNQLERGIDILAEDYWGTGVAWGMGAGEDKKFLLELNSGFLREDLAFLFVGERFATGLEKDHKHETDEELIKRVDEAHRDLAKKFGWKIVNANESVEKVNEAIFRLIG